MVEVVFALLLIVDHEIKEQISNMDQKEFGSNKFTRYEERYQIPLVAALACFVIEFLLGDRRRQRSVWTGRFEG